MLSQLLLLLLRICNYERTNERTKRNEQQNYITSRKIHNMPRASVGGTCVGEEGRKRRLGFGKKGKSSFTVHRSEEVLPPEDTVGGRSGRQPSSASSDGEGSGDGDRSDLLSLSRPPLFFISLSLYFFLIIFALTRERPINGRSKEDLYRSYAGARRGAFLHCLGIRTFSR